MKREGKAYTETKVIKGRAYHYLRFVVTVDGKRKERRIRIKAEPGTQEYDRLYWEAMSGYEPEEVQKEYPSIPLDALVVAFELYWVFASGR